jgi:hypothetical protein
MSYEKDVQFDKHNLDVEWERQPELAYKYCAEEAKIRHHAENVKLRVDEAKAEQKRVAAEVYLDVCKNPEKFGLAKTTNPLIDAAVETSQQVIDANEKVMKLRSELNQANHELDLVHAAVQSITTDKRQALSSEVELWSRGYFGTPSVKPNEKEAQQNDNVNRRMANEAMKNRGETEERKPIRRRRAEYEE